LCKEDYCVYLRDDTQSAALLAYHRPGGFHRLLNTSRYADWRTSSGFAQFRPEQSSVETAQSRGAVSGHCKKTNIRTNGNKKRRKSSRKFGKDFTGEQGIKKCLGQIKTKLPA